MTITVYPSGFCRNGQKDKDICGQLSDFQRNVVDMVSNKTSLAFFNRLFLVLKPDNKWKPILDLSPLNKYLKSESFKMETPESISTFLANRGMGNVHRFQGRLLPLPHKPTVQEIPASSCFGWILPIQRTTIWSVHCSYGIHDGSQGSPTDGSKQGEKRKGDSDPKISPSMLKMVAPRDKCPAKVIYYTHTAMLYGSLQMPQEKAWVPP